MSDETDAVVADAAAVEAPKDAEAIEEAREKRNLKFWLVKAFTATFLFVFAVSVAVLVYAAVVKDKDLDTGYLGAVFKLIFEFLTFALT